MGRNVCGSHRSHSVPYTSSITPYGMGVQQYGSNNGQEWSWSRYLRRITSLPKSNVDFVNETRDRNLSSLFDLSSVLTRKCYSEDRCNAIFSSAPSLLAKTSSLSLPGSFVNRTSYGDHGVRRSAEQTKCHLSNARDLNFAHHCCNTRGKEDFYVCKHLRYRQIAHPYCCKHGNSARPRCSMFCPRARQCMMADQKDDCFQVNDPIPPITETQNAMNSDPATQTRIRKQGAKCLKGEAQRARACVENDVSQTKINMGRKQQKMGQGEKTTIPKTHRYDRHNAEGPVNRDAELFLDKLDNILMKDGLADDKQNRQSVERKKPQANALAAQRNRKKSPDKKTSKVCHNVLPSKRNGNSGQMHDSLRQKRNMKTTIAKPQVREQDPSSCHRRQDESIWSRKHDMAVCTGKHQEKSAHANKPPLKLHSPARLCSQANTTTNRPKTPEPTRTASCTSQKCPSKTNLNTQMQCKALERSMYVEACKRKVSNSAPGDCFFTQPHPMSGAADVTPQQVSSQSRQPVGTCGIDCTPRGAGEPEKPLLAFLESLPDDITQDETRALVEVVVAIIERRLRANGGSGQDLLGPQPVQEAEDRPNQSRHRKYGQKQRPKCTTHHQRSRGDPRLHYSAQSADALSCATFADTQSVHAPTFQPQSQDRTAASAGEIREGNTLTCVTLDQGDLPDVLSNFSNDKTEDNASNVVLISHAGQSSPLHSHNTSNMNTSPHSTLTPASNRLFTDSPQLTAANHAPLRKSAVVQPCDNFASHNTPSLSHKWDGHVGQSRKSMTNNRAHDTQLDALGYKFALPGRSVPMAKNASTFGRSRNADIDKQNVNKRSLTTSIQNPTKDNDCQEITKRSPLPRARSVSNIDTLIFTDTGEPGLESVEGKSQNQFDTSRLESDSNSEDSRQCDGKTSARTSLMHDHQAQTGTASVSELSSLPPCPHDNKWRCGTTSGPAARNKPLCPTSTAGTKSSTGYSNMPFRKKDNGGDNLFSLGIKYKALESTSDRLKSLEGNQPENGTSCQDNICEVFPSGSSTRSSVGNGHGRINNDTFDLDALSCSADTVLTDTSISKRLSALENDLFDSAMKDWKTSATKQYVRGLPQIPCTVELSESQSRTVTGLHASRHHRSGLEYSNDCLHPIKPSNMKEETMTGSYSTMPQDACHILSSPDVATTSKPDRENLITRCDCTAVSVPPVCGLTSYKCACPQLQARDSYVIPHMAWEPPGHPSQSQLSENASSKSVSPWTDSTSESKVEHTKSTSTTNKSSEIEVNGSQSNLKANTDGLLAKVYHKYYPDRHLKSMRTEDRLELGKALNFLGNFSPIQPADVNTRYPTVLESSPLLPATATAIEEQITPQSVTHIPAVVDLSQNDSLAAKSESLPSSKSEINKTNSKISVAKAGTTTAAKHFTLLHPTKAQSIYVSGGCKEKLASRGKNELNDRVSDAKTDTVIIDVTSQNNLHDPVVVRTYNSKSAIPVSVRTLEAKSNTSCAPNSVSSKISPSSNNNHVTPNKDISKIQKNSSLPKSKKEKVADKANGSRTNKTKSNSQLSSSRSLTIVTAASQPQPNKGVVNKTHTGKARSTLVQGRTGVRKERVYSITNKSLGSETEESDVASSSIQMDTKNKCSSCIPRPSTKILGELAFQLERRILDYVFGLEDSKRRRFYGYTVSNICEMMEKECKQTSGTPDPFVKTDMASRLKKVLAALHTRGYNIKVHSEFAQETVNKYGLLASPPDPLTIEDFGLQDPTCIAGLIFQLGTGPAEIKNLTVLLDSLTYLSKCDGRPLFVW